LLTTPEQEVLPLRQYLNAELRVTGASIRHREKPGSQPPKRSGKEQANDDSAFAADQNPPDSLDDIGNARRRTSKPDEIEKPQHERTPSGPTCHGR
ncbi:MAG: hypothetical protein M3Y27_03520, partial [Acidobacteriota bacterium]|nr:hypothetical protein [Acidobacteriota bacterium]